ncbi:hypothetical protein F3Y22_tig00004111pilonHSYRG00017 [Hibiscus syriacus]|uniref:Uncharacterized protein n=1 Tax=Hibiscus syriacus TaxID=106335 RepID=A0A6A3CMN8_HIBSY|nr:hypothetical protein F3Y22_tig00004111pilonHSYRG00017 [Hibiscus syriacus]
MAGLDKQEKIVVTGNKEEEEEERLLERMALDFDSRHAMMWEGEVVFDVLEDHRVALQSVCCPCYRFGKNMRRASLGDCFLQGTVHFILAAGVCSSTSLPSSSPTGTASCIRRLHSPYLSERIQGSSESRTLEMNNVKDGTWHGHDAGALQQSLNTREAVADSTISLVIGYIRGLETSLKVHSLTETRETSRLKNKGLSARTIETCRDGASMCMKGKLPI